MKQGSHIIAAIGQVHRKHCAAAVAHRARPVLVQPLVVMRRNVAAGEVLLDPGEKARVHGHQILVLAVGRALFHHPHFAVALDDLGLDFADLLVHQVLPVLGSADNGVARFLDATRAQRIGLPRPAQCGLALFPGLQQRLIGPFGRKGWIGIVFVEELDRIEDHAGRLTCDRVKCLPYL